MPHFEGDLPRAMVFTAILQANVRDIWNDPELNKQYGDVRIPPDAVRRPISISSVAASLGMPRETVRRHVMKMEATGQVVRTPQGLVVPASVVETPEFETNVRQQYANVRRLVQWLRTAGVSFALEPGEDPPATP